MKTLDQETDLSDSPSGDQRLSLRPRILLCRELEELNAGGRDMRSKLKVLDDYDRGNVSSPVDVPVVTRTRELEIEDLDLDK